MLNKIFGKRKEQKNESKSGMPDLPQKHKFHSEELFRGQKEIVITHGNSEYRLQQTKSGKLILNK